MKTLMTVGLDMAARSFVAALWFDETRQAKATFANTVRGFQLLARWMKGYGVGVVRAGIECTNVYGQAIAAWLHAQGHEVYLLNPQRTHYYAKVRGQRNKTDPADAVTIAAFTATQRLTRWVPPPAEQVQLTALARARADLVAQSLRLGNQIRTTHPSAKPYLQSALRAIKAQIKALEKRMQEVVRSHEHLKKKVQLLTTIKGIGWLTATIAVAELPAIDAQTNVRSICAWAGLIPARWQSGKTELPAHISKRGNKHLRQALFMPALVAKKRNPLLCAFAEKLAQKGKRPGAIAGAVAHKLLRIIVGILKSNTSFDPNWSLQKT